MALGSIGPAHPASHRRVVLLPEARALRRSIHRGSPAPEAPHPGTGPRGARAALPAGVLEGHRGRLVRAAVWCAHGATRRADAGAAVREGRWRIPRGGRETAG